jgi:hypothetical protein
LFDRRGRFFVPTCAVIGVAAEAETPAGQFLVEIVEHEIAQEGARADHLAGCPHPPD